MIVRRRLRYETWYAVHFTAYAAIALGWFHQIPTGNELVLERGRRRLLDGALRRDARAARRVPGRACPSSTRFRYRLRVAEVIDEGPGVVSLRITGRRLDRLDAQAGQFFLWRFLTRGGWWEAHPFSLSAAPDGRSLRITVKSLGDFTSRIGEIAAGTRVVAEGPFGVFTDAVRRRDKVAADRRRDRDHARSARCSRRWTATSSSSTASLSEDDVVFRDELEQLAAERGIALHYVVGDHATPRGRDLLSPDHLRELVPDIAERDVYVCGPPAMADGDRAERPPRRRAPPLHPRRTLRPLTPKGECP